EDNLTVGNHYNAYLKELAQSENGITGALEEIDESWFLKGSEGHLFSNPRSFIEFERESYFGLVHGLSFIMSWNTFDNTSISQSFSNLASKFTEIRDLFQRNFTGAELDELLGELYLAKDQAVRNQANSHARSFLRDMEQKMFAMLYSNPSPDLTDRWSQLMDKLEEMRDQLKEILTGFGQLIVPFAIANGGFDPATDSWRIGLTPSDLNIANEFRDNFLARL
ncbi:MAG: hypothetical protein FWG63_06850, partial [Defluviitaleaceae bacterium]|nr:hypothetical protein [Defluviitaleaceae bacterium]